MNFKAWLESTSQFKIGLYPDLADIVGQYPPLYGTASSADYIYYVTQRFGKKGSPPGRDGVIKFPQTHGTPAPGELPR